MKSTMTILGVGLFIAGILLYFIFFHEKKAPHIANKVSTEGHYVRSPTYSNDQTLEPDNHDAHRFTVALDALASAYRTLVRSTALPSESVDSAGRMLPKDFSSYLANENSGFDQFISKLSTEEAAAFQALKESLGELGVIFFTQFLVKQSATEKPSAFDFVNYSAVRELVHEYPAHINNGNAQGQIAQQWTQLSQSANPVFRFLAIQEANRVVKDKTAVLALLDARSSEIDPVIVQALINQYVEIGGPAAKTSLKQISANALARHDANLWKAAEDAVTRLK